MKFKEYEKQIERLKKHPAFSITITENEIHSGYTTPFGNEILLFVSGSPHIYFIPKGCVELYTIDKDGNKKDASCFKLDKPLTL